MTTNWTIASDTRFKAAMSGAGIGHEAGPYGVDQYIYQYDTELGPPWRSCWWTGWTGGWPVMTSISRQVPCALICGGTDPLMVTLPGRGDEPAPDAGRTRP
jgi:hypothetical protein